ncbi:Nif3-like dinuclear metal center hexameric protein [bacterium]|nr:Nif3-like dinuclear metal center hexameric protein [candidate division CSSED10-310 bacterium]
MKCRDITDHLEAYLRCSDFDDYCVNGIQVEGQTEITRIVTGVSVSQRLFEAARKHEAELIIVHHGLFWKSLGTPFALTGLIRNRVSQLLKNNLNLAAYHLPLDAHPVIGNNARIMDLLGISERHPFDIGFWGEYSKPVSAADFQDRLATILPNPPVRFPFGNQRIRRIAVISGGASRNIEDAADTGADAFVTGEISEQAVRIAEELKINCFAAGHYNTERFGPMALAEYITGTLAVPAIFVDIPNPV